MTTASGAPLRTPPEPHLLAALWRWADRDPDRPLLSARDGDRFCALSAAEVKRTVRAVAAGLIGVGVAPGDRVLLLSRTRREWVLLDHAILAAGAVTVPVYDTASPLQVATILANSGSRVALVETAEQREVVTQAADPDRGLRYVFAIEEGALDRLAAAGLGHLPEVDARIDALRGEDLAAVLYSSGTTGEPKGCELTHANLAANVRQTVEQVPELFPPQARTLAFLPLAHALARMQVHVSIDQGVEVAIATDLDRLADELTMVHPTFLVVVPRLLEKILAGARGRAQDAGRTAIFDRAMDVAQRVSDGRRNDARVPLGTRLQHRIFDRLVYRRLRDALGGQVTTVICGGAALAPEIGKRFDGIGIPVLEGFGATETAPIVSGGPFAPLHHGTVGRPYPATTVRVAEDGEILVQGPQVFRGYRGDPEATATALRDGWYHTGDLGELTSAGHLRIVGRKKDILITAGGKNVVPGPLEDRIRAHPLVEECVVLGERRPFVTALLWLDTGEADRLLARHGMQAMRPTTDGEASNAGVLAPAVERLLRAQLDDAIADANRTVSRAEAIGRYAIVEEPLSLAAGSLTPTTKVRRAVVLERFAADIEQLYAAR
ncbi:MAG: long-chain fatty acid--CoA ligase [Nitriliruptoraceae bacterium]